MFVLLFKFVRWLNKRFFSTAVEMDGLWIGSWDDARESISKVREALSLIATHDLRRYRRLSQDLEGVWVIAVIGSTGKFSPYDYICELDLHFVRAAEPERIASVIVHEAIHARLWRIGFRYAEAIRPRIEAVCVRQQQAFAARLPRSDFMAEELNGYLEMPATTWSDKSLEEQDRRGMVATLRGLNIPNWVIGAMLRRRRAKLRRRRQMIGNKLFASR